MTADQTSRRTALSAETRQPGTVRANRAVLALFGLLMLLGGAFALLAGLGVFGPRLESQFVLPPSLDEFVARSPWFWSAVAAIAVLVAVLSFRWLSIQVRSDRLSAILIPGDGTTGSTSLDASAFTEALETEISGYRGVTGVSAHLSGNPHRYRATVRVSLDGRIDAGEIQDRIVGQALPMAREALSVPDLPCRLEFDLPKVAARDIR